MRRLTFEHVGGVQKGGDTEVGLGHPERQLIVAVHVVGVEAVEVDEICNNGKATV
jgi:hypothetical protein